MTFQEYVQNVASLTKKLASEEGVTDKLEIADMSADVEYDEHKKLSKQEIHDLCESEGFLDKDYSEYEFKGSIDSQTDVILGFEAYNAVIKLL